MGKENERTGLRDAESGSKAVLRFDWAIVRTPKATLDPSYGFWPWRDPRIVLDMSKSHCLYRTFSGAKLWSRTVEALGSGA